MQDAVLVLKDTYFDSVMLMAAAARVKAEFSLPEAAFFMANPANRKLLREAGFAPPDSAGPADVVLAVRAEDEATTAKALEAAQAILTRKSGPSASGDASAPARPQSLDAALAEVPADLAVLSIPGPYVEAEASLVMAMGKNAFIFSDNVPVEAEKRLKTLAAKHGVLCMGPDCGTGWLDGYGVGFSNAVPRGRIGIVSASGTGLQAVACHLADLGEGVSQGIGVGGRDLSADIGGLMTFAALERLDRDPATELIIVISKPPAPEIMKHLLERVESAKKPIVMCCQGMVGSLSANVAWALTLVDAARTAVSCLRNIPLSGGLFDNPSEIAALARRHARPGKALFGAYTGGTLAHEAELLIEPLLPDLAYGDESVLAGGGSCILDFGDDRYTQGKPHPMIDPSCRRENMVRLAGPAVGAVLFDIVLGRCSHPDPAGEFVAAMEAMRRKAEGADPVFVGAVAGTDADSQNRSAQEETLRRAGALVMPDNAQAARLAALLVASGRARRFDMAPRAPIPARSAGSMRISRMLGDRLAVVNIGVDLFADSLAEQGAAVVRLDWRPPVSEEVGEARLCLAELV